MRILSAAMVLLFALLAAVWRLRGFGVEPPGRATRDSTPAGNDAPDSRDGLHALQEEPASYDAQTGPGASRPEEGAAVETRKYRLVSGRILNSGGEGESRFELRALYYPLPGAVGLSVREIRCVPGSDGQFSLEFPGPGRCMIGLRDWPSHYFGVEVQIPVDKDVDGVEFRLPEIWDLTVRLVSSAGLPIPDGQINVASETCGGELSSTSGADGICKFRIFDGQEVRIRAELTPLSRIPGLIPAPVVVKRGVSSVDIVSPSSGLARGVTLGPDGNPTSAGLSVIAEGSLAWMGTSASDGRFELRVPLQGACTILAGSSGGFGQIEGVHAGDGDLEIRLVAEPMDRQLLVRVAAPAGPLMDREVEIWADGDSSQLAQRTGNPGEFVLQGLRRGTLTLSVRLPLDESDPLWIGPGDISVRPDQDLVEVHAVEGLIFRGTLKTPDGSELHGHYISVFADEKRLAYQIGAGNEFKIVLPRDGTPVVRVAVHADSMTRQFKGSADRIDPLVPAIIPLKDR